MEYSNNADGCFPILLIKSGAQNQILERAAKLENDVNKKNAYPLAQRKVT